MTEFVLEQRLRQLRQKGNVIFPMFENKKYFLKTWSAADRNNIRLQLVSGYGLNESKKDHLLNIDEAEHFFSQVGFEAVVEKKPVIKKPENKNVNYSLHSKPTLTYKYSLQMSEKTETKIKELRQKLFSAIDKLESGTMKHEEAKAIASLAQTIINSTKLELDYKKMVEKTPNIEMLND